jgi:hypothetical protein
MVIVTQEVINDVGNFNGIKEIKGIRILGMKTKFNSDMNSILFS